MFQEWIDQAHVWLKRLAGGRAQPQAIDPSVKDQAVALQQVLRDIIDLLTADGEHHWRAWMASSLQSLEANDVGGARHLLGAYGGMGSFNDLVIGQRVQDEGVLWTPGAGTANDRLDSLRSQAYGLAETIVDAHP